MNTTLRPYEHYVDMGLPLAQRYPGHWALQRIKFLFNERSEKGFPDEPLLASSQSHGVIAKSDYATRTVEAQKDLHLLKLVEIGDYVISLRSFQGGIEYSHARGIISPAYTVLAPGPMSQRGYFEHLFKSAPFVGSMSLYVTGIREGQNIDYVRLSREYIPVPPPDEQESIGRFIRYIDLRVNRLIKAKKRLIELLNEQKQAIIHQAVTRGLDPDVPMKPGGEVWPGTTVPRHWHLHRLKDICTIQSGLTLGKQYLVSDGTEYPYLRVANVQAERLSLKDVKTLRLPSTEAGRRMLRYGDLLLTEGGDPDKLGRACIWRGEIHNCLHQNHVFALRCYQNAMPEYVQMLLNSSHGRLYFERTAKQTTNLAATNKSMVYAFAVYLPTPLEQAAIVEYVSQAVAGIDHVLGTASSEINLLREYRTRLVADVVTGQLDVRHLQLADVPEVEESCTDDESDDSEAIGEQDSLELE